MRRLLSLGLVGLAIIAGLLFAGSRDLGPVLITHEDEQKMVLRLGSVATVRTEPGLWWRIPLLDDVLIFEKRLLYFNADPISIQTEDAQPIIIDYYVLWSWHYNWFPTAVTAPFDTSPGPNSLFDPANP